MEEGYNFGVTSPGFYLLGSDLPLRWKSGLRSTLRRSSQTLAEQTASGSSPKRRNHDNPVFMPKTTTK